MSVTEIIKELPKLTPKERATLRRRLREMEEQDDVLFLHEAADSMFVDLDKQEAKRARSKAR